MVHGQNSGFVCGLSSFGLQVDRLGSGVTSYRDQINKHISRSRSLPFSPPPVHFTSNRVSAILLDRSGKATHRAAIVYHDTSITLFTSFISCQYWFPLAWSASVLYGPRCRSRNSLEMCGGQSDVRGPSFHHGRMARGGHGLSKFSPRPAMPYPSMPWGGPPLKRL
jgi:hypothetical protein